jgi:hypothetical protein
MMASGITAIAAVGTLVAGLTFGIFSAVSPSQTNTFTAGTVTLGAPTSVVCNVGGATGPTDPAMEAGDTSTGFTLFTPAGTDHPCQFTITYTGTIGAFIGVTLTTSTTTTPGLYNPPPATNGGLQFQIADANGTSYTDTTGLIHTNTSTPLAPLFVGDEAAGAINHFTVNYGLPLSTTNTYQGTNTTLTLTVYAVQDSNNGTACTTKGVQCATITTWGP